MRVFNCAVCNTKAIDNSAGQNKKYCCQACANKARYGKRYNTEETECKFNSGVTCAEQQHCHCCGWNPAVEKKRKAELYK